MRAISTVLDVAVFVLLVSAGVATLATVQPPAPADSDTSPDETVTVLTSSTLSIEYELDREQRRAHGTIGSLLARGATASATVDGDPLSTADSDYREQVQNATRKRLVAPDRTQIAVRWTPYSGAPVRGGVIVGPDPPEGVDVHTATTTIPAPVPASRDRAREAAKSGYEDVGHTVAVAVATGLLPSNRVDAAIHRRSPTANASAARYMTVAEATGVTVDSLLRQGELSAAHQRATDGLTEMFAADMRERFDSPQAAAETVRTGEVRIVVRRWEP